MMKILDSIAIMDTNLIIKDMPGISHSQGETAKLMVTDDRRKT